MPDPGSLEFALADGGGDTVGAYQPSGAGKDALRVAAADIKQRQARSDTMLDTASRQYAGMTPPKPLQFPAEPQEQRTSPGEQWGSLAMLFAAFGSLTTRRPFVSALNSAAAVMNAYSVGDTVRAKQNLEKWKVESEHAEKMAQFEHEQYRDQLDQIRTGVEFAKEAKPTMAALKETAAMRLMDAGHYDEAMQLISGRGRASGGLSSARAQVLKDFEFRGKQFQDLTAARHEFDAATQAGDQLRATEAKRRLESIQQEIKDYDYATTKGSGVLNYDQRNASAGDKQATQTAVRNDVEAEHPDWTVGQVRLEVERRFAAAKHEGGEGSTNRGRAQVEADVRSQHPDFTPGQVTLEADRLLAQTKPLSAGNEQRVAVEADIKTQHPDWSPGQVSLEAVTRTAQARQGGDSLPKLDKDAVDFAAKSFLVTGQMPAFGMGRDAARLRSQIISRAAEMSKEQHASAGDVIASRAGVRADSMSLGQLTKMSDSAISYENTALKNMEVAESLMDRGAGTGAGPVINRWLQAGRVATGDPDVAAFHTAVNTVANEFAKIMSGSTGAAAATEGARAEAQEMVSKAFNTSQLNSVFEVMRLDMENRKRALEEQQKTIKRRIQTTTDRGDSPAAGPGAASSVPEPLRAIRDLHWSPSRQQYRDGDTGAVYDVYGTRVQ